MKNILLSIAFVISVKTSVFAQQTKFDTLTHKMFFNILCHRPDSSILYFVKTYFPALSATPDTSSWTIYPPSENKEEPYKTEHNFYFKKHPFFNIKFDAGCLKLQTSEAKGFLPRISHPSILFDFNNKIDADKALTDFVEIFKPIIKSKKIILKDGVKVILLSDEPVLNRFNCVEFILYKNELFKKKYEILFNFSAFTYSKEYYGIQ